MSDLSQLFTEAAATSRELIQQRQAEWEREWIEASERKLAEFRAQITAATERATMNLR